MTITKGIKSDSEKIIEELESIKKLLILTLLNDGVTQAQLAKTLNVSQPSISRMIPSSILKN